MKRCFDLVAALSGLLIFSPIFVAVAVVVRIIIGSPVLFRQTRPGFHEKPFQLVKFRTMKECIGHDGKQLPDAERLVPLGKFLRKASLDELPELWNVVRGDLSLVGPRPLLMNYLPYFTEEERLRFTVRPGITGWAQIHGRNMASWSKRLENDIWYVKNRSFFLDLKILWLTVSSVLRGDDIVVDARSTMLNLDEERASMRKSNVL